MLSLPDRDGLLQRVDREASGFERFVIAEASAPHLSRGLWKSVSAAVCTSATLTACGSFDFFDRLSGMNRFPERRAEWHALARALNVDREFPFHLVNRVCGAGN